MKSPIERLREAENRILVLESLLINFIGRLALGQAQPEAQLNGMKAELMRQIADIEKGATEREADRAMDLHKIASDIFAGISGYLAQARGNSG